VKSLQRAQPDLVKVTIAGDLRRGCELVGELSLVAQVDELEDGATTLTSSGNLKVYLTDSKHFGATLLFATGAPSHLQALVALAKSEGLKRDERGRWSGRKLVASKTEADIYKQLGLSYIEPQLREGADEIARSRKGTLRSGG
jgi:DNA polymerase (family 10)